MKWRDCLARDAKNIMAQFRKFKIRSMKRMHTIQSGGMRFVKSMKKRIVRACTYKDEIGYYAVLAIVLVALSAAAYDYRGKKNERALMNEGNSSTVPAQVQIDPTLPPEPEDTDFIIPVCGTLIGKYSDDKLVWSTTLQMWQTHPAIDIAASPGEAVIAAADGEIVEAYSDALLGNTITIDHGDSKVIRYASLNTIEMVSVGQKVKRGDIIGSVGTCTAEAEIGSHVHLEYTNHGLYEDFLLLLNESNLRNLRD